MSKSKSLLSWKVKLARQRAVFSSAVPSTSNPPIVQHWQQRPARRTFHQLPSHQPNHSSNLDGSLFNSGPSSNTPSNTPKSSSSSHNAQNALTHPNDIISSFDGSIYDSPALSSGQSSSQPSSSSNPFLPFYHSPSSQPAASASNPIARAGNIVPKETRAPTLSLQNGACGIPKSSHSLKPSANPEHVAAANISMKQRVFSTSQKLTLSLSGDAGKSVSVGQDAYFLRPDSLGVADGVGGWAGHKNADPALFSRLLMQCEFHITT